MTNRTLRVRAYPILERAVEEGIEIGWQRAHKHTPTPDEAWVADCIQQAIMVAVREVFDFPEEDEG